MKDLSVYDVPGAVLEARGAAYRLLEPDADPKSLGQEIIEKLTAAIRAMGRDDIGLVLKAADLGQPSAYTLPDGSTLRAVRGQWIIERDSGAWLAKDHLGWEFPPQPSSRDEKFYARVSFATPEDAMDCWRERERSLR